MFKQIKVYEIFPIITCLMTNELTNFEGLALNFQTMDEYCKDININRHAVNAGKITLKYNTKVKRNAHQFYWYEFFNS